MNSKSQKISNNTTQSCPIEHKGEKPCLPQTFKESNTSSMSKPNDERIGHRSASDTIVEWMCIMTRSVTNHLKCNV